MEWKRLHKTLMQKAVDSYFAMKPTSVKAQALADAKLVAHRGAHKGKRVKENTFAAFDNAVKAGAWGIEFDIRWTKDHVPMVHHDADCKRIFDIDLTLALENFDTVRKAVPEIPTLAELVERYGQQCHYMVELKEEHYPDIPSQKAVLTEHLSQLTPVEDFHFISLKVEPFDTFDQFDPAAYLFTGEFNLPDLSQLVSEREYGGLLGHYLLLNQALVEHHRARNQHVGVGYIRSFNSLKRELNREMDWIFTNDIEHLAALQKHHS